MLPTQNWGFPDFNNCIKPWKFCHIHPELLDEQLWKFFKVKLSQKKNKIHSTKSEVLTVKYVFSLSAIGRYLKALSDMPYYRLQGPLCSLPLLLLPSYLCSQALCLCSAKIVLLKVSQLFISMEHFIPNFCMVGFFSSFRPQPQKSFPQQGLPWPLSKTSLLQPQTHHSVYFSIALMISNYTDYVLFVYCWSLPFKVQALRKPEPCLYCHHPSLQQSLTTHWMFMECKDRLLECYSAL